MVAQLLGLAFLFLPPSLVTFMTHAQISTNGEVVYQNTSVYGVVNKAVILACGPTLPDMYIWSFTKPGTEAIKAVVYDLGEGPKVQRLAETLGQLAVISNSAAVSLDNLQLDAQGLFTCQAFYDIKGEPKAYYYYVRLIVQVPISKPTLLMSNLSPVEGSTLSITCILENGTGPIQYMWQQITSNGTITTFAQGNKNMLNVTNVRRNHTGFYQCVATNPVNSETSNQSWLNIIFGPDTPQIDVTPYTMTERGYSALERDTVSLLCQAQSNPASQYVWFYNNSQVSAGPQFTIIKILRMHTGDYACLAHNTYLDTRAKKTISLTVYYPPDGSPSCSMEAARNYTALSLHCSWPGGFPSPSLQWTGYLNFVGKDHVDAGQHANPQINTTILQQSEGLVSNNSLFTCIGSHLALKQSTTCSTHTYIPPTEPECLAYETNNKQYLILSCAWEGGVPKALVWWEGPGDQGKSGEESSSILILHYGTAHSGKPYTCHAKHSLLAKSKTCNVTLGHPMPPNVTLIKVMYNSLQRNEVELEWQVHNDKGGGWTGFFLEHTWISERPGRRGRSNDSKMEIEERIGPPVWYTTNIQDPDARIHTIGKLTPTANYKFRITPVNHRTIGYPSEAKTPAEPRNNMYPAVVGAAIGGMLFAAIITVLLLVYIVRNRNNNPRLHDMLFGSQHSQSRENINFPEDEVVGGAEGGTEEIVGSPTTGSSIALPRAASALTTSPLSATPTASQSPAPGDDNEPVSVTITVKATGS
ncbi:hypothetical protein Q8A73_023440 [Channa argus]|nr:hypothetical protein Q8A73_023440 [Channa argus]